MTQRFGKHGDKTVAELIDEDPAYIIWLYEQDGGEFTSITFDQYATAIEALARMQDDPEDIDDLPYIDVELDDE